MRVDRQTSRRSLRRDKFVQYPRHSTNSTSTEQRAADSEVSWRIRDRWLFDADNEPSVGHDGPDEHPHTPAPQVSPPRGGL